MTRRMIRAIENPFVKIIGHPTGRLLGRRPMYPLNVDEIIEAAAENNTVLEINGSPSRLDLGPEFVRKAKRAGVRLAVNTDAHAIAQLAHRQYGVNVARRGGVNESGCHQYVRLGKITRHVGGVCNPDTTLLKGVIMEKRTRLAPAKRAIIIGMDGASMELVKNMIDWGHTPNMAKLLRTGVYRPMLGVFPTLTSTRLDRACHRFVAWHPPGYGF